MKLLLRISLSIGILGLIWSTAFSQAANEATIQPDTKAQISLRTRLSSNLSEVGDTITATFEEPLYVDGQLVIPRGTEVIGRVTQVSPAGRGMKGGQLTILFDKLAMPWGEEPVSLMITAIDDWGKNKKLKADDEGKVNGGHNGDKTINNVERGGRLGSMGAGALILLGGGRGGWTAGGVAIAGGMASGVLLSKGGDIAISPGTIFRVKFSKPLTLPIAQRPARRTSPSQEVDPQQPDNQQTPTDQQPPDNRQPPIEPEQSDGRPPNN